MSRDPFRRSFILATLAVFLVLTTVAAATETVRPRIGLVLGGGGARGAAHVGVLEELEKLRVPVDCVAGTSMGALVAGAFAAGLSPEQMREFLAKADWNDMFQDNPVHSEINLRNKALEHGQLSSAAIFLGGETPLGPLYLGYGRSSRGDGSFHLFIGTP